MVGLGQGGCCLKWIVPGHAMPVRKDGVLGREAGQYHGGAGCLLWCEEQQSLE